MKFRPPFSSTREERTLIMFKLSKSEGDGNESDKQENLSRVGDGLRGNSIPGVAALYD